MPERKPHLDTNGRDIRPLSCPGGRLYVCARKFSEAIDFAKVHGVRPDKVVYLEREHHFCGLRKIPAYFIGRWWELDNDVELLARAWQNEFDVIEVYDWR